VTVHFLHRILIQVVCCTVRILHAIIFKPFLCFGKRSSCIALSGSSYMRTAWKVRRLLVSKANISPFSLQVLPLLHRPCFLGMSHLNRDPTAIQGSAAMNLRAIANHHQLPQADRAGIQNHRFLMLEKKSCKRLTNNATFLQQRLLSAFSHLQRKVLRGTSKCTCPASLHHVCLKSSIPGRTPTRVLTAVRQWVS